MRRTSKYYDLPNVVEVRVGDFPRWEVMAAFNHPDIAERYAVECKRSNASNAYRVMQRGSRGQFFERFNTAGKLQ